MRHVYRINAVGTNISIIKNIGRATMGCMAAQLKNVIIGTTAIVTFSGIKPDDNCVLNMD